MPVVVSAGSAVSIVAVAMGFAIAPGVAGAARAGADRGLSNLDRRADRAAPVLARTRAARRDLQRDLGALATVRTDRASGAVAYVGRPTGLLTGPSKASPQAIALGYVRARRDVFGLTKADLASLVLVARDVSPDGIAHLRFNQVLDGYESVDSGIRAHVTRDGRLISISGAPVAGASLARTTPGIGPGAALGAARVAVRGSLASPRVTSAGGARSRATSWATGERARLRWSATSGGPRLAWDVVADGGDGHLYDVLVDAAGGDLLRRQDLTLNLGEARYFTRDPDHTPVPVQITMAPAWFDDSAGGTRLWGQYARTYVDPDDEDPAAGGEAGGTRVQIPASAGAPSAPDWLYTQSHAFAGAAPCPSTGCTWDDTTAGSELTNEFQAATNVHVLNSRFHDYLAQPPIGFDEASGNFQRTNATAGGFDGDYVRTEVDDGQGLNNANMSTPPDGFAPRMQMFLFTSRDANGSDVADVVYHEYAHGLSNRLVVDAGGGSTLNALQPQQMGEAWSDFYALDLLQAEGSVTDTAAPGEVTSGDYLVGPGGIRAKAIDCPVDAAGATAACNHNDTATTILGGYTYGDIASTDNSSPHNGSEVWAETLWDIRGAVGRAAALALITGGMRLSANSPSMLDMRDAILQQAIAMRSAPGAPDDRYAALWGIFAARGFGGGATTPSSGSAAPTEAFDAPTGVRAGDATLTDPYPDGDDDGLIEAGETFRVSQPVIGIGLVDLPGVTGVLSSSNPDVAIVDATAAWPLLGRGRSAPNADPLVARMPVAQCTATSSLTVAVASTEGTASATTSVDPRPASNAVVAIADDATTTATFLASGSGDVTDVDLRLDELRHTFLGDLVVALVHDGVTATVFDPANGFNADDFVDAIVDDEAATAMPSTGSGPISGRVRPTTAGALAAFDGHPVAGTWTLRVTDGADGDAGEIRRWGLDSAQLDCTRVEIPAAQTGAASAVTETGATLAGSVTPNGRATGLRFAYGTTTAYGSVTATQDVGSGDAAAARSEAIGGLAAGTTYHFRTEAIREGAAVAVAGGDATFATPAVVVSAPAPPPAPPPGPPPPPSPPRDATAPRFAGTLRVTLGPRVGGRRRPTYRFKLSEPATVRAVVTRAAKGGRSRGTCMAPRPGRPKCTRQLGAGTTSKRMRSVAGTLRLMGGRRLPRGSYTAKLTATDAAGNRSAPKTLRFTVR